jgi:TPR repeat protein
VYLTRATGLPESLRRDDAQAMKWLQKGCELEHPESMLLMASWLTRRIQNVETEPETIAKLQVEVETLYRNVADSDSTEATQGQFLYGELIVTGGTIIGDMKEGLEYLLRAARDNSKKALLLLAGIVERGENGVIANPDQARRLRERAAMIPDEE